MPFNCGKLVIVGAGLIGGSLVKALKAAGSEIGEFTAVGRNLGVLDEAKNQGFIDSYSDDVAAAVRGADVVIIGTPVGAMRPLFERMYETLPCDCVVSDVGSVKASVVEMARTALKNKAGNFVPAHPISGTEHSGFNASFAELFQDRYTVITPLDENPPQAVARIKDMWLATGSHILEMSVDDHDRVLAATSHLPHVLVYALMNTIAGLPDADKYFQVVAGGFLDYTRIASSNAVMWRDVCLTNREPILKMIGEYRERLAQLEVMIANRDGQALFDQFARAKQVRDDLVDRRVREKTSGSTC